MWRRGLKRLWLPLALLLLASPLSYAAEPSAREKALVAALAEAEAALGKAKAALKSSERALAELGEESTVLREQLAALKADVEKWKADCATLSTALEAQKRQSDVLASSLETAQKAAQEAENWAIGLGIAGLLGILGGIFLW